MGKQRGERSKSRPSSSSLAASLVSSSPAQPAGFGFGGFVGSARVAEATKSTEEEISADIDGEVAANLRRLSKRDSTTKLKALAALAPMLAERPPNELAVVLPSWVFIYRRLAADASRQVREQAHLVMKELASRVGRSLAPHLRVLMGPWWTSQFDPSREVAEAARASFQAAFPAQKKQVEVLAFCQGEMFEYLDESLSVTPQTVDKSVAPEEAADWIERQLSASLLAMATLLQVLGGKDASEEERASAKVVELAGQVSVKHRFFAPCVKHQSLIVRGAAYQMLRALCESAPQCVSGNVPTVAPLILGSLSEKEPGVHRTMWDMLLSFARRFPEGWGAVNMRKSVLPGLWSLLKHAAYGSAGSSYPCLLVLVSLLPPEVVGKGLGFWRELFSALWGGREMCISEADLQALLRAWRECLVFVASQAEMYAEGGSVEFQQELVTMVLLDMGWEEYMRFGGGGAKKEKDSAKADGDVERGSSHARAGPSGQDLPVKGGSNETSQPVHVGGGASSRRNVDLAESIAEAVISLERKDGVLSAFWPELIKRTLTLLAGQDETQVSTAVKKVGDFYMALSRLAKRPPVQGRKGPSIGGSAEIVNKVLDAGVKPLVAGVWQMIVEATDSAPLVRLLARVMHLCGPISLANIASREAESQFEAVRFFVTTRLVPWCLGGGAESQNESTSAARLDLLLAVLSDEKLQAEWQGVLGRLTRWARQGGGSETDVRKHLDDLKVLTAILSKLWEQGGSRRIKIVSPGVDSAALTVAGSSELKAPCCQEFLRLVLGRPLFVSSDTVRGVLEKLLSRMEIGGGERAVAAVEVGGTYALSKEVPPEVEDLRARILVALFSLSWTAASENEAQGAVGQEGSAQEKQEVNGSSVEDDRSSSGASRSEVSAAAQSIISLLEQDLVEQLGAQRRASIQQSLVQVLRSHVAEGGPSITGRAAKQGADLMDKLAVGQDERESIIDGLLAPMGSWPKWSREMLELEKRTEKPEVQPSFAAFAVALMQQIEPAEMLLGKGKNRAWLAVEILVTAEESGDTSSSQGALQFLEECARDATDTEFALLHHVVDGLVKAALRDDVSADVSLRALVRLLEALVQGGAWGENEARAFFVSYLAPVSSSGGGKEMRFLACVLPVVMPLLQSSQSSDGGAVNRSIGTWLDEALMAPPLTATEGEGALEKVLLAVSCFPLHAEGGKKAVDQAARAPPPEKHRAALLDLLRRQFQSREAMAAIARDAALKRSRAVDSETINGQERKGAAQVEEALARLIVTAVAFCWAQFEEHDWDFVLKRVQKWLEQTLSAHEERTEALVENTARETSHHNLGALPLLSVNALELLLALPLPGSSAKAIDIGSVHGLNTDEWLRTRHVALQAAFRLVFLAGVEEGAVQEEGAAKQLRKEREEQGEFWNSASKVCQYASVDAISEAAAGMDAWAEVGVGQGAIASLHSLLFSPNSFTPLQKAAHHLLMHPPLLETAVTTISEDEVTSDDDALVSNEPPAIIAGVRPEMATLLETRAGDLLLAGPLSSLRVHCLLAWSLALARLRSLPATSPVYEKLVQYVQETGSALTLLEVLFQYIPLDLTPPKAKQAPKKILSGATSPSHWFPVTKQSLPGMAASLYMDVLRVLPACARLWFMDLRERSVSAAVEAYTSATCSSTLLEAEFEAVQSSVGTQDNLSIRANRATREVIASYTMDESSLEMVIRLPASYPLRPVEVECTRRVGVSESRLRKWLLSISAFLRHQNGAVSAAVLLWKQNVEREFEGVEECPICYSVIHTTNHALPRLPCKTCKHKFHAACLYKWFASSHKSTCPLCQTPF